MSISKKVKVGILGGSFDPAHKGHLAISKEAYKKLNLKLKSNKNIYWLLGGIYKKGDKFNLPKKYYNNIKAFIYGKNKKFFNQKRIAQQVKAVLQP